MQEIIITTVVIGVIGLVIGIALVAAGKKFYVAVDEKAIAVRECLREITVVPAVMQAAMQWQQPLQQEKRRSMPARSAPQMW